MITGKFTIQYENMPKKVTLRDTQIVKNFIILITIKSVVYGLLISEKPVDLQLSC